MRLLTQAKHHVPHAQPTADVDVDGIWDFSLEFDIPNYSFDPDALAGDPTHFARMDNVEEAWRIVGPAVDTATEPLPYRAGTWGPSAADTMPGAQGWQPPPPVG